jgi:hypothetical protein
MTRRDKFKVWVRGYIGIDEVRMDVIRCQMAVQDDIQSLRGELEDVDTRVGYIAGLFNADIPEKLDPRDARGDDPHGV